MKKVLPVLFIIILLVIFSIVVITEERPKLDDDITVVSNDNPNPSNIDLTSGNSKEDNNENEITQENIIKEDNEKSGNNANLKPILYFYNYGFVGYNQNNKWYSPVDMPLKNIFNNDFFTLYTDKLEKVRSNKVSLMLGAYGYGGFDYDGSIREDAEGYRIDKKLGQFADSESEGEYIFNLPKTLDEELNETKTINLPDCEASAVKFLSDDIVHSYLPENGSRNLIAFNADYDLNILKESSLVDISGDVKEYLKGRFEAVGVSKDLSYKLVSYYKYDLNNDGKIDEVYNIVSEDAYLLNTATDETYNDNFKKAKYLIKNNGGYSAIIVKINDEINAFEEFATSLEEINSQEYDMIGTTQNYSLTITDLNNDNIYEILYNINGYEYWDEVLAIYENNTYHKL